MSYIPKQGRKPPGVVFLFSPNFMQEYAWFCMNYGHPKLKNYIYVGQEYSGGHHGNYYRIGGAEPDIG